MYKVEEENGTKHGFESLEKLEKWIDENDKYAEPNVELWGMDETLTSQGAVCLYDTPDEDDTWITATVKFEGAH